MMKNVPGSTRPAGARGGEGERDVVTDERARDGRFCIKFASMGRSISAVCGMYGKEKKDVLSLYWIVQHFPEAC